MGLDGWIICELRVTSCELIVVSASCECELRVVSWNMRAASWKSTSCEFQSASWFLRVASCEFKSASCELQNASWNSRVENCELRHYSFLRVEKYNFGCRIREF